MTERPKPSEIPAPMYETFNIGNLCGVVHQESPAGNLIPADIDMAVAGAVSVLVNRYALRDVQCIDLGGGLGVGFKTVRSILPRFVNSRITCTVTNKEQFNAQDSVRTLEILRTYSQSDPEGAESLLGHWFSCPSASELAMARRSRADITYVSELDTTALVRLKEQIAPEGFHLVHEYFGGLEHHHHQRQAMQAVMESLHPKLGMLITGFNSLLYWESLHEWETRGITVYGAYPEHQFMTTQILILAYPDAPIAPLERQLGYMQRINTESYRAPTADNQAPM